jgi:hypothetical protein
MTLEDRRIATYDDTGKIPVERIPALPVQVVTGAEGPSAYDVAVANGFTGTEAEWLASLAGADAEPHAHPYAPESHAHADADIPAGIARDAEVAGAYAVTAHTHPGGSAPVYVVLAPGTTAMGFGTNDVVKVTPTATATYTTTVPAAGKEVHLIVLTSGVTSRTITFGTGFKPVGTLATGTTTARVFVLSFVSDGLALYEVSRTAAMAA